MKKRLMLLLILPLYLVASAQNREQFTQYMYNTMIVNPAYVGSKPTANLFTSHRNQWVGLNGAPKTNSFSASAPLGSEIGLGISVLNEKIGASQHNDFAVNLSYTIRINDNYELAFGVKGGIEVLNVDYTKLTQQSVDPVFQYNLNKQSDLNFGTGLYLFSDRSYLGISAPYLVKTDHIQGTSTSTIAAQKISYQLMAGYVFDVGEDLKFKPSLLSKYVPGAPLQADISGNFLIKETVVAGLAYRWSAAVSGMLGVQVSNSWFVGYSYDFDTTSLGNYNSGSHEIFLRFEIFPRGNRIITPRFF